MPYKDKERQRQAQRDAMDRKRHVNPVNLKDVNLGTCETFDVDLTQPQGVCLIVIPSPKDGWPDVKAYISRESPRMANLERLQRIAGSLGKCSGDVWFGVSGLTMEDIGSVIGTKEGLYARS